MTMLSVTADQRQGLFGCIHDHENAFRSAALADTLLLPDDEGGYGVPDEQREVFVHFLEHEMMRYADNDHTLEDRTHGGNPPRSPSEFFVSTKERNDSYAMADAPAEVFERAMRVADGDTEEQGCIYREFYPLQEEH